MFSRILRTMLGLLLAANIVATPLLSQDKSDQNDKTAQAREREKKIEARDRAANGIQVGEPKVYDDSLLQQMLSAAQARLMSLQVLDQTGIASRLGSITGASQTISSFGLSLQGPPSPQVATTNNGATNSTVTTGQTATTASATPSTVTTNTVQNTAGVPVTNVTTTAPSVSVPTVTAPAPSTTLPTSFSVSASDILNEQMQLTYEIANLRLLLEGSLNDRIVGGTKIVKPRVTVGFPITLTPDKRYRNAVAIVEVEVEKQGEDLNPNEPPALLALLPREKTYNMASITDKSVSIGAGVVTQVASVAGSFLHATKTYYLVQDQDTLALTYQPEDPHKIGFLWQFRPVLGAEYIKSGLKQTFVQIAFPSTLSASTFGAIHVRTYWKSYDRKKSITKGLLRDSLREYPTAFPIWNFPLDQHPKTFDMTEIEDLGNGQLLVTLRGRFLGGTYVRVGSNILADGSPGFISRYQQIQFVSPIADLATKKISLVARDGNESPLLFNKDQFGSKNALRITGYSLTPVDDANSRLTVQLTNVLPAIQQPPLVFLIGGKVFGYTDAPIRRNGNELSVILPTAFLIANPVVSIRALFTDSSYWENAQLQLSEFTPGAQAPKMALLEQATDSAKFLLYGNGVDQAEIVSPAGAKADPFGNPPSPSVRSVTLKKEQIKSQKQLALQMKDGLLFLVPIPSVEFADFGKPVIKAIGPVVVGTDEVIFQGEGLADLQKVVFNGIELKLRKQADGKHVWVKGLRASGATAESKAQTLDFYFKSGKTPVTLTVSAPKPS